MAKREYTSYQRKTIARYYENLDTIMLQKLQELVSDLFLADTAAKQERLWGRVDTAMKNLKVPASIHDHIMKRRDVQVLAENLKDWLGHTGK
ncbi:MAG TPA: hypothetical protein VMZ31_18995 [Phycisphaerae bacterium]|nr:hypothetical protein [Phycisphaerae bacterium]